MYADGVSLSRASVLVIVFICPVLAIKAAQKVLSVHMAALTAATVSSIPLCCLLCLFPTGSRGSHSSYFLYLFVRSFAFWLAFIGHAPNHPLSY